MSAPSGGATSAPQCACTNISIMQLFHELKQQFPGVPDHVVSTTISSHRHDRSACQLRLQCEAKKYISHLYPSSSLSGAKKETKDILCPPQCPNQLIITKEVSQPKSIQVSSVIAQKAVCSYTKLDENQNENIVKEEIDEEEEEQSESEEESSGSGDYKHSEVISGNKINSGAVIKDVNANNCSLEDIKTFQIIKSNKVTSNLNEKLVDHNIKTDGDTDKIPCDKTPTEENRDCYKVKRPTTLELPTEPQLSGFDVRTNKETLSAPATFADASPKAQNKADNSTCKCQHKCCDRPPAEAQKNDGSNHLESQQSNEGFPLNLSVNLNCRMDVHPSANRSHHSQFQEPWRGSYSNPANITSVNLTVCTPTGSEDKRGSAGSYNNPTDPARQRGFEGHVQITVSPASAQPPLFRGTSVIPQARPYYSPISNIMPESPPSPIDNLLRRQRARLQCLQNALAVERSRLISMQREVNLLRGPPPNTVNQLWPDVQHLRKLCQKLARQLDRFTAHTDGEFYATLYTGQQQTGIPVNRNHPHHHHQQTGIPVSHIHSQQQQTEEPNSSWQCHVCTFRNNAFLNKCEQCDMPRIILVHADEEIRVELTPGRSKVMQSWI